MLEEAITDSLARGAVGVETSTIHAKARKLYQRHYFKQTMGDIGEGFLELDVDEYLQVKKRKEAKKLVSQPAMKYLKDPLLLVLGKDLLRP